MYKGTVLHYLRKYIKNLQSDQLESYLLSGECTLHAIELEPEAIVEWVSDLIPYTVEIEKVFCSKVDIKIPWAQIRTKPLLIGIHQMEVTVRVHDFREQDWAVKQAKLQKNHMLQLRIVQLDKVLSPEKTLKQHELSWVDIASAGMQVRVEFCRIKLLSSSPSRVLLKEGHACTSETPAGPESNSEVKESFTIDVEGMFLAPCHHGSGWSVSYVDNPDQVYEYLKHEKILRRSRLLTLKSVTVSAGDRAVLTHSPGFRMRMTSDFACVNLLRNRKRYSIPTFPSSSTTSVWMDRVSLSAKCSCELAALYAVMQDLSAPVIVPAENLSSTNKSCHYTFRESEILSMESKMGLEGLKELFTVPEKEEEKEDKFQSLPPIGGKEPKFLKKTAIVSGGGRSSKSEMKKLFAGLARDVSANANKVTEQTDKIVTQGKKLISSAISTLNKPQAPNRQSEQPLKVSSEEPQHPEQSPHSRASRLSSMADSEYFTDAVSGDDEAAAGPVSVEEEVEKNSEPFSEGHFDGFALWMNEDFGNGSKGEEGGEFELEAQLVVIEKLCIQSLFHLHLNELGVVSSIDFGASRGTTVSIVLRRMDFSSESLTALTESQFSVLSAFCRFPESFLERAKSITKNAICPGEAVHSSNAFTAGFVQVTVTPPATSPDPISVLVRISNKSGGGMKKSFAMKWKARCPPPSRFIKGTVHLIETGSRFQIFEGCIHGVSIAVSGWTAFTDLYTQMLAFSGDFPDPTMDPVMRMRLCVRDAELVAASELGDWRVSLPNGMISRNLSKNQNYFADLLAGFQTLTPIPEVHFGESLPVPGEGSEDGSLDESSGGFPFDGAFCACICGQESATWSWALPNATSVKSGTGSNLPLKIKFPNKEGEGIVSERTWKKSLINKRHIYIPETEFSALLESKLKVAEQDAMLEQLQDKYAAVIEEISKKDVFLKEKWAVEAVQFSSKESVVEILTQKVCVLEKLLREEEEAKSMAQKGSEQVRLVSAAEVAAARKELVEESQKLKFKLENSVLVQESLADLVANKDKEIALLKQQREFLLGIGVKSTSSVGSQTDFPSQF